MKPGTEDIKFYIHATKKKKSMLPGGSEITLLVIEQKNK